jgi:DNA polymerase III epsilon subunit-like protein
MIKPDGFDPNDETTRKALEVNKITLEQIECAPAFLDVLPRICETLSCPIWVAHNLEFDLRMLRQERARLKGQPAASATVPRPALKLCTMLLDVSLGPSAKGRSLAVVAERWGAPVGGPVEWKPISAPFTQEDRCEMHNAWSDAATAAAILMRMLPKLPARCSDMTDLMREGERRWTKIVEARKRIDRERASDSES